MTHLSVHAWGDPAAPRVVCLHGVTSHGRHFARLADRLASRFQVVAPDLLGHGDSPYEPPWSIEAHLQAVVASVGDDPAVLIGHSFGGRLAYELAARRAVDRLVLLDPAIRLEPAVSLFAAENARRERAYASFEEAIERRYEESQLHRAPRELLETELRDHLAASDDGLWRYRSCQAAVVSAYGAMASAPPAFDAVRIPTLLVLGEESYLPYDHLLEAHAAALGDLLRVVRLPGGHTVLWDALDETCEAVETFLRGQTPRV